MCLVAFSGVPLLSVTRIVIFKEKKDGKRFTVSFLSVFIMDLPQCSGEYWIIILRMFMNVMCSKRMGSTGVCRRDKLVFWERERESQGREKYLVNHEVKKDELFFSSLLALFFSNAKM